MKKIETLLIALSVIANVAFAQESIVRLPINYEIKYPDPGERIVPIDSGSRLFKFNNISNIKRGKIREIEWNNKTKSPTVRLFLIDEQLRESSYLGEIPNRVGNNNWTWDVPVRTRAGSYLLVANAPGINDKSNVFKIKPKLPKGVRVFAAVAIPVGMTTILGILFINAVIDAAVDSAF